MDDAFFVSGLDTASHLLEERKRLFERERSLCDPLSQSLALDELHHEKRCAALVLEPVQRRDVRVIQRRENVSLALEALKALLVLSHMARQYFDRNVPAELGVMGAEYFTHTAFADLLQDAVVAERLSDHRAG